MGQALHSIESEPDSTIEIVVHITETLGDQRREDLVTALEGNGGITAAEFCPFLQRKDLLNNHHPQLYLRPVADQIRCYFFFTCRMRRLLRFSWRPVSLFLRPS